jgi:pimeloyl-ACP methyl ester carboxylesterase
VIGKRIDAFPSNKLTVGGKTLAYRQYGEGRPLVLLHGIGSGSAAWRFQLEGLADRYRVIAWDAPGYGESDAFSIERPHPADYARALSVLLNALQAKNFVLVAHSLGALVATAYARMFPSLPGMVLISPAGGYEDAPHYPGNVLVACGSADTVTPEAGCRDLAARFPNSLYRTLPGLGHASPIEGPAQVNALIREFAC